MFDKRITDSDKFIDLPNSTKALYFMAGMNADDRGFFQPRRLQKECGFTDDDYKILIAKKFFIAFESGVMVITDWNKNNYLDNNRVTETEYIEELKMLQIINGKYELNVDTPMLNQCLTDVKPTFNQNSIEENSIEENRESNTPTQQNNTNELNTKKSTHFIKPTLEEIETYIAEKQLNVNAKQFYEYFETGNWVDSKGNKVKSWKQKLLTWNNHTKPEASNVVSNRFFDTNDQYSNIEDFIR